MAGIILDINDDIKRLQQLKAEIESVKKALTSINVKVDIDIAKGLEARLQKLMGQYDALVGKIAASEAKVKEAESRMNSATQRIMEAQERMAQAATGQGTNTSKSGNTTATNAQTASIKEQARAYDDLKNTVATFLGTVEDNAKFISETSIRIKAITANISTLNNVIKTQGHASVEQIEQLAAWNKELAELKLRAQDARRELNTGLRINIAGKGTLKELQNQLLQLQRVWENMTEDRRISPIGQQLAASIEMMNKQVSELEQTMGRYQRNVGNYASGFNSLGMSVQQIVRELPAATMGLNMFFLAISNNLPILTDEIKRAAEANKALKAQNQETIPVWKQLVSSIFSWQTALIVAITAMSMYGKEIVSWIGNLFKAKDATEEVRIEQEKLNKSMADARKSAAEETAGLRTLYSMTQNQNASMQDRLAAVNKLQQQYPAYFGNISKEAILAGQASAAYQQLTKDIMAAAYARAYQDRISDLAAKNIDNYNKSLSQYNYLISRQGAYDAAMQREERRAQLRELMDKEGLVWRSEYADEWAELRKLQDGDKTLIKQFNRHHELWENANKDYQRIEKSIEGYQSQALKYQNALMKTEQGSDYVEDTKSQENEAKRIAKERERIAKERLKAQSDVDKDLLSLQQNNQDDEIALMRDGTEKKLAEIDNDYKKRIAEIEKQEAEFKKKNNEAGITGLGVNGLTKEQQNALQEAADNAAKERERQTQEVYAAEAQAMRDYLKEYGTFQQQKLAIAEEYAEKIKNAQSEGERLSLTAERDKAMQQVEINAIKQNIDWGSVFGDFGTMFRDQLQPTIDRLRQIANSDTFKQSSLDEQQVLYELINKLENANAAWDSDIFKRVSDDMKAYQEAMRGYAAAVDKARIAEEKLANAQSTLDAAKRGGLSQEVINAAQAAVDEAQEAFNAASEEVTDFGAQVQETTTSLNSSATEAKAMFEGLADGLQGLKSGSLQGIGQGIMSLDSLGLFGKKGEVTQKAGNAIAKGFQSLLGKDSQAAKTLSAALGDSGLAGEIISAILGMLDMLAEGGIGGIASNLADTVLGSVNSILDDIFSGGIVTKPIKSLVDGLGGILDTVTFGGFSSWGNNTAETKETIERLTTRNEALIDSLDRLNDTMKEANGAVESVAAAEQAKEYQQEVNENYRDIAAAQAGYQGKHHSWSKYFNDWLDGIAGHGQSFDTGHNDWETWQKMNEIAGFEIKSRSDFLSVTPEQMAEMLADVDIRQLIQDIGEGGYGAKMLAALEDYADQAGKIEEIDNSLRETLTQISFDSMYDSFIDTLMDMDASAEDFADDFSEYMMRALLSNQIGTMFKDRLQEWYTAFAEAMEDGVLTDDELKQLREDWNGITADAMAERDKLAEATGYDNTSSSASQQQASSKGFETMSQDMAGELSGRFTALNETGLRIEAQGNAKMQTLADLKGSVAGLEVQAQGIYNIADETRSILANSYLELQEINENTGNSAKYLKDIKTDIAIVKQNTSRI